ncbi:MAG: zf-HC2 domain-containing protein, partial [Myxococcota bacterium]
MTTRDDRGFESLLERGLREGAASAGACPDPELLAGYLERSLPAEETKRCEAHFASCLRCQEELAAIVRMTDEPARRTFLSWLRLPVVRWMAPLA